MVSHRLIPGKHLASRDYVRPKSFVQSPFRYPGGKYYALKFILPILDSYPHDEYLEPFVGGGSVFFAKQKASFNHLNDLERDLIETYKAIKSPSRHIKLSTRVKSEIASRERHDEIKRMAPRSKDEVAFRTYYLNRTSYSGIINKPAWGYAIGSSSPPENWPRFLTGAHHKLRGVRLTSEDFSVALGRAGRGDTSLAYLDPPYFLADQRRAYTKPFELEDHLRLERTLRGLDFAFVLSYDDCAPIRDLYKWAFVYPRTWFHNTANSSGPRKIGRELLITNFKVSLR